MQGSRLPKNRRIARPLIGCLAVFIAVALLSATMIRPTAAAGSRADGSKVEPVQRPDATFPGTGVGAIPDSPGGTPPAYGTPLVISFVVSGVSAPITDVSVNLTLTHTWCGDLDMVLAAPGGSPNLVTVGHIGVTTAGSFGSSSDFNGNYNFTDIAVGTNIWTAAASTPIAPGNYRTTVRGMAGTTNPPALTSLNSTFGGLTAGQANGTWTLTIRDGGNGDTGTVTAANLNITGTTTNGCPTAKRPLDFDGDGKTDITVVRNTGGGQSGQVTWFMSNSSGAPVSTTSNWGIATDFFVPSDYDGDGKSDIAVWRPGPPFGSYFYILQSGTGTLRFDQFGQTGDDPSVVGDYDGDGKADPAVYRAGAAAGAHSFWYYRSSISGMIIGNDWGQNGDFPAPGDYDGDGKYDFVVQRSAGGGQANFYMRQTTAGDSSVLFGTPNDMIVPGYYDADCKTDIAVVRVSGGAVEWYIRNSTNGAISSFTFGLSASDYTTQGDYDGDGATDIAVWRPSATLNTSSFYWRRSLDGVTVGSAWGQDFDYPPANFNSH